MSVICGGRASRVGNGSGAGGLGSGIPRRGVGVLEAVLEVHGGTLVSSSAGGFRDN